MASYKSPETNIRQLWCRKKEREDPILCISLRKADITNVWLHIKEDGKVNLKRGECSFLIEELEKFGNLNSREKRVRITPSRT